MADSSNFNGFGLVVDQIQHSVITDPNPIAVVAMQLLDSGWARVVLQLEELGGDAAMKSFRQMAEFFFGRAFEDDCVGHDEWLLGFSGGKILAQWASRFMAALLDGGYVQQIFPKLPVVQQILDHRFPFGRFEAAESCVHGVGCLSDDVCHAANLAVRMDYFNTVVVGDARNWMLVAPHMHFEMRDGDGKTFDPAEVLRSFLER